MKNVCRKGIPKHLVLLVVVLFTLMSFLTACDTGSSIKGRYDLDVLEQTSDFYVNDFAGVFTEEQKSELMAKAVAFDKEYSGIQVVITTVPSLNETVLGYEYVEYDQDGNVVENGETKEPSGTPKFTIEEVAYSMYSQYGIGQDDMGILILFSTGDREVRIETGRNMQFYITDTISGRLLDDYGMEDFSNNRFAEGLISVQAATIEEIKSHVSADWYTASNKDVEESKETENAVDGVNGEPVNEAGDVNGKSEPKDPSKGILWGIFGSIGAAFAAIFAFIRQKLKGKKDKESFEKAKEEEISSMRTNFQNALDERDQRHSSEISSLRRNHNQELRQKDSVIQGLETEVKCAEKEARTLKTNLEIMTDKYERAQRLHPEFNFEEEVHEMIESEYKAKAQEVDQKLAAVIATVATKDNYATFKNALFLMDTTDHEVKKYVTSDRSIIQGLYDEAIRLKEEFERQEQEKRDKAAASSAYEKIKKAYGENRNGNHETYNNLHAALAIFLGLTAAQKAFFPDNNLISNLKRSHSEAETDYNNYKAAKNAESEVESVIGYMSSADEDDRDKLSRAMRYYRNLSSAQAVYFSQELLRKLKRLIEQAEDDHRRQERRRDDARRAAMRSSSSSSFSSSSRSSFGGHGGRPSGGGASRRF